MRGRVIVGLVEEVLGWDPQSQNNYHKLQTSHFFILSFMISCSKTKLVGTGTQESEHTTEEFYIFVYFMMELFTVQARTTLYLEICAAACQAAVAVLRNGGSALDAAEHATRVLEDAGETNAG